MRVYTLFIFITLFYQPLLSQSIEREVIGAVAHHTKTNRGTFSFSGGESAISVKQSNVSPVKYISEGFLQPNYQGIKILGAPQYCPPNPTVFYAYGNTSSIKWYTDFDDRSLGENKILTTNAPAKESFYLIAETPFARDSILLRINSACDRKLIIYEYITPNNDGNNDVLFVENIELSTDNRLVVYDSWGNRITKIEDYKNDWIPTGLEAGVYIYIFDDFTNEKTYKGKLLIK